MANKRLYLWLALATFFGLFVGTKWNQPLAAWLAPIFALRFCRDSPQARRAFGLLWLTAAASATVAMHKATFMAQIHPLAEPLFFLLITPLGLIPYLMDRAYHRRFGPSAWQSLIFPVALTATDFLLSGGPYGTFGALGYSQRGFAPTMQVAAVTGIWGLPFLFGWVATLVNHFWEVQRGARRERLPLLWVGLLVGGLLLGALRPVVAAQAPASVAVAGFSLPAGTSASTMGLLQSGTEAAFRERTSTLHRQQLDEIARLADAGAAIVVLQEGAGMGMSDQVAQLLDDAGRLAQQKQIYIVLPTFDLGQSPAVNSVQIIDPSGAVVLKHVKFGGNQFERTLQGDMQLRSVETPYGRLSAVICWDADFPAIIKQAGEQQVELLFIPSQDWAEVAEMHAGMATFRAVENGLAIVRQTGQGVSLISDGYGRVLQQVNSDVGTAQPFTAHQQGEVPVGHVATLYPAVGDSVGTVASLGLLGLLALLWPTRARRAAQRPAAQPLAPQPTAA